MRSTAVLFARKTGLDKWMKENGHFVETVGVLNDVSFTLHAEMFDRKTASYRLARWDRSNFEKLDIRYADVSKEQADDLFKLFEMTIMGLTAHEMRDALADLEFPGKENLSNLTLDQFYGAIAHTIWENANSVQLAAA